MIVKLIKMNIFLFTIFFVQTHTKEPFSFQFQNTYRIGGEYFLVYVPTHLEERSA